MSIFSVEFFNWIVAGLDRRREGVGVGDRVFLSAREISFISSVCIQNNSWAYVWWTMRNGSLDLVETNVKGTWGGVRGYREGGGEFSRIG